MLLANNNVISQKQNNLLENLNEKRNNEKDQSNKEEIKKINYKINFCSSIY